MDRHKAEGTTWKGVVINNRKGLDPISVEMKVMPVYDAEASRFASQICAIPTLPPSITIRGVNDYTR